MKSSVIGHPALSMMYSGTHAGHGMSDRSDGMVGEFLSLLVHLCYVRGG